MPVRSATEMSLEDTSCRRRLSAPAFQAFVDTAGYLVLTTEETLQLLGVPATTFNHYVRQGGNDLSHDTLERISIVLGVTKALREIFADDEGGRRWLRARNSEPVFAEGSPLAAMQRSIGDLYRVRAYLDSWREGP